MKIAFDHEIFCRQRYGGISRYFFHLAQEFLKLDIDVNIFAPFHINKYLSQLPEEVVHGKCIDGYLPRTFRLYSAYNNFFVRRQIRNWKPNITHETYYSNRRSGPSEGPSVLTVYDMIHELGYADNNQIVELKRQSVERADHVICISENTRRDLVHFLGTPKEKISVVHLGFDAFLKSENCDRRAESVGFQSRPYLLYLGPRVGYKNFSGLLRAVATSQRLLTDFDVVAFGGHDLLADERDMILQLGLGAGQVKHIIGDDSILGTLYNNAAAFVYPSLYEGFGLPPLEAMAHSCPVVSSNSSSMPEVIGDAAEFFDPSNVADMRRAIEAVVYSSERRTQLIEKGRERLGSFSWQTCAEQTLAIYQSLQN